MGRRRRAGCAGGARQLVRKSPLIPANAGIQLKRTDFTCTYCWVPAFRRADSGEFPARSHFAFRSHSASWSTMAFIRSFAFPDFLDSLVSLFAAFVLGTLIGAERQYRQRGGDWVCHSILLREQLAVPRQPANLPERSHSYASEPLSGTGDRGLFQRGSCFPDGYRRLGS